MTAPCCLPPEVSIGKGKPVIAPMFVFLLDRHLDFAGVETTATLSHYAKRVNIYPVRWELAVLLAGDTALRSGKLNSGLLRHLALWWSRLTTRRDGLLVP